MVTHILSTTKVAIIPSLYPFSGTGFQSTLADLNGSSVGHCLALRTAFDGRAADNVPAQGEFAEPELGSAAADRDLLGLRNASESDVNVAI